MKTKSLTIYEIKRRIENAPYFFSRQTLRYFGQTLKSFSVKKRKDGKYLLVAPIKNSRNNTVRIFNPLTNTLERI